MVIKPKPLVVKKPAVVTAPPAQPVPKPSPVVPKKPVTVVPVPTPAQPNNAPVAAKPSTIASAEAKSSTE